MTQGERVKIVRKESGLTLEKFGEKFGMSKSSISDIENGRRSLTNQTVLSICREFNVLEPWLRDGEGEMHVNTSRKGEIVSIVTDIMNDESDARQKLISVLTRMTPEETELLLKVAVKLAEEVKNAGP